MAHCGKNTKQITAYGPGYGTSKQTAEQAAELIADVSAKGLGMRWIDEQECPDDCPYRDEKVRFTGKHHLQWAGEIAPNYWLAVVRRRAVAVLTCTKGATNKR